MPNDLRMPEWNKAQLDARLCADPDLKYLSSGTAVCNLRLAHTRHFKKANGEKGEETIFIDAVVWGTHGEYVGETMKKGHAVLVDGSLVQDEWEDKDTGAKRSKIKIRAQRVVALEWHGSTPKAEEPEDEP